jgi:RimJ/RimL family protein N-acetyltransferase
LTDELESGIETARLILRPMRASDVDDLLHIFADARVMASFDGAPFDRAQMERWTRRNLDHQSEHGFGLYAVVLKADGVLIGDCGLEVMEMGGVPAAELGYDFRSDYWNQGYATEAATAVRDHAFATLGLPRLISLIRVGNGASRRVSEKIGMRLVAEITRHDRRYWEYALERAAHSSDG